MLNQDMLLDADATVAPCIPQSKSISLNETLLENSTANAKTKRCRLGQVSVISIVYSNTMISRFSYIPGTI